MHLLQGKYVNSFEYSPIDRDHDITRHRETINKIYTQYLNLDETSVLGAYRDTTDTIATTEDKNEQ